MSLRTRIVVLFVGLLSVLAAAELWLVHALTRDLSQAVERVAEEVGQSVVRVLADPEDSERTPVQATEIVLAHDPDTGGLRISMTRDQQADNPATGGSDETVVTVGGEDRTVTVSHPAERSVPVEVPRRGVEAALDRFTRRLVAGSAGLLAVALVVAAVGAHQLTRPLRRLNEATRAVAGGALGAQAETTAPGEVGATIEAFNAMSRRLAELDSQAKAHEQRRQLSELGEVARGLAHSLRNPLNTVGLALEQLAAEAAGRPRAESLASSAREQIRRLDRTIRSFLALASQAEGENAEIDVGTLLRDVVLEASQAAGDAVRVELSLAPELPLLLGLEPEVRAATQVLVENGVEASEETGAKEVTVAAEPTGDGALRIRVMDRGPGVPKSVRPRLFAPHVTSKPQGAGMGLFLARRIASTRYGGHLQLEDRPGGGTTAVLELRHRADGHAES